MTVMHTFPLGAHRLTISAYCLSGNGGVERVYRTMATTLAIVCNEHPNDWDVHLSHVEYASAATGLAFNEVHIGGLPRLPLDVFDRSYVRARQSFNRGYLAYCDLARERQQRAYELVREQHARTVARVNGLNSILSDALLRDILLPGNWTNPPSALHPIVPTAARQRSRARDRPHQR